MSMESFKLLVLVRNRVNIRAADKSRIISFLAVISGPLYLVSTIANVASTGDKYPISAAKILHFYKPSKSVQSGKKEPIVWIYRIMGVLLQSE